MKNTDKITLTIGQLKRLLKESKDADHRDRFDGEVEMTCYNIYWSLEDYEQSLAYYHRDDYVSKTDPNLPSHVRLNVYFRGYLHEDDDLKYDYYEAAKEKLKSKYGIYPYTFEWQIDDYGD